MSHFTKLLLTVFFLTASAGWSHAAAGYVITEETQGAPGGKPAKKITYMTDTAQRIEERDKISILTLNGPELKLYEISPREKKITDASRMAPMMLMGYLFFLEQDENGKMRVKNDAVTPTAESRKIGKWTARKVLMNIMGFTSSGWYTRDSRDLLSAERMRMSFFAKANEAFMKPHMESAAERKDLAGLSKMMIDFSGKMLKDYGASVMTEMNMGGITARSRVVSVEGKEINDDLFLLPEGYTMVSADRGAQ